MILAEEGRVPCLTSSLIFNVYLWYNGFETLSSFPSRVYLAMSAEDLFQWPPDSLCFASCVFGGGRFSSGSQNKCFDACSVTDNMVNFLNLTATGTSFFQAYCVNPPPDDSCPMGYCPNSDIAGMQTHQQTETGGLHTH